MTQQRRLKGTIQAFILVSAVALVWIGTGHAQPAPAPAAVKPKPAAMKPVAKPKVMKPAPKPVMKRAVAPKPKVMKAAAKPAPASMVPVINVTMNPVSEAKDPVAAVPSKAPAAPPMAAMAVEPTPAPAPKAPTPVWKTSGFWIGIGSTVLGAILMILLAFGVITKKQQQWLKDKEVAKIANKVASGFESYAKGTKAKWDDVAAAALKAVVAQLGALTEEQEAMVKRVVDARAEEAAIKQPDAPESAEVSKEDEPEADESEEKPKDDKDGK